MVPSPSLTPTPQVHVHWLGTGNHSSLTKNVRCLPCDEVLRGARSPYLVSHTEWLLWYKIGVYTLRIPATCAPAPTESTRTRAQRGWLHWLRPTNDAMPRPSPRPTSKRTTETCSGALGKSWGQPAPALTSEAAVHGGGRPPPLQWAAGCCGADAVWAGLHLAQPPALLCARALRCSDGMPTDRQSSRALSNRTAIFSEDPPSNNGVWESF